ncbi:hypothetical protein [Mesorhizobium caraganae]|uniref:hypothetical protein n=1 Tax=Mesorhizobium caraganae TaxID=483206 RepID=UPI00177C0067|nr:hypothetical protein [Mesorhizobium caraganae]
MMEVCKYCGRPSVCAADCETRWLDPFPSPQRRDGKEPCGECRIQPGETCDICGASAYHDEDENMLAAGKSKATDGVLDATQFLIERLEEFERADFEDDEWLREYTGHVVPALVRLKIALRSSLAALPPPTGEPVAYASAGQLAFEDRPDDGDGGVYIPLRKVPGGLFQTPLYLAAPLQVEPAEGEIAKLVERLEDWETYLPMREFCKEAIPDILKAAAALTSQSAELLSLRRKVEEKPDAMDNLIGFILDDANPVSDEDRPALKVFDDNDVLLMKLRRSAPAGRDPSKYLAMITFAEANEIAERLVRSDGIIAEVMSRLESAERTAEEMRKALEPNLFWDDENPEESFTSIEDLADYIGERAICLKVRTARSLPDAWVSAVIEGDDNNWVVKYHDTKEAASAEVTRARALAGDRP